MSESGQVLVDDVAVEPASSKQPEDLVLHRTRALQTVLLGAAYIAVYVFLDLVSSAEHLSAAYSWNPQAGASIAAALMFGRRMVPFMFIAPLVDEFVDDLVIRPLPFPLAFQLASTALIGGVYGTAALFLLHPKQRFDPMLQSMHSLALLTVTTAVSTAAVATIYAGLVVAFGVLPTTDFAATALSYWIGDAIGIMVLTPLALIIWNCPRALRLSTETCLQFVTVLAALVLVYVYWTSQHLQLVYVLFVPIVWIAVRSGIEGVCVGLLLAQLGFIFGFYAYPDVIEEMPKIQALMLVLALTGLFAGALVTERRRTEAQLRLHQDALARLAQVGSMGELAAALAHELNQPLMAAGTYTRLVGEAISSSDGQAGAAAEAVKKATAQIERAAEVVHRLRALVRLDQSNRIACEVDHIVQETISLCQPDLDRVAVRLHHTVAADLSPVMVDVLQIEQALLNLVRNSIDAIGKDKQGTIWIEAATAGTDFVQIRVRDSGPGFPSDVAANPFLPFLSTKKEGLGFGLPLCRSLVEANGDSVWLDVNSPGDIVCLTLPVAEQSARGPLPDD